ncbi:MAG: PAS domain-containing protein [Candidatus Hydrogenedentes bacterium]|nr:PAS domain-containing protein [Candidatus Hydrogenedentota bacterium]
MRECLDVLGLQAAQIAADAAETADVDELEDILVDLVHALAEARPDGPPLDISALERAGIDSPRMARVLRAVEAECIENLRVVCERKTFPDTVLTLRDMIRRAIPRQPLMPWCAALAEMLSTEEALAPEQSRILRFFDHVTSTTHDMVYAHDINGNMFFVNDAGLRLIKFSREDLFDGMSVYDFVVQEYVDLVEARLESPGALLRVPYSIEIYAKDGERVPIEIDTKPLQSETGEVVGVVGIARDLRLERRLQDEIQRSNAHLEHIVSHAPLGILTTDEDAVIRDANAAAASLCGVAEPNALIGLSLYSLGEHEDDAIYSSVARALDEGQETRSRVTLKTRFGPVLNCDVVLAPLRGAPGAVTGLLVLLADVSEQLELQRNLAQAEKLSALGQIVAGVAHEFNNPLTGILGYTQYLLTAVEQPKARGRLEQIMEEAQRCRRLVQNLLSFADRGQSEKAPYNINELLREVLALYEYQLRVDRVETRLNLDPDLPNVSVAPQEVQRAFLNIISNAHLALNAASRPEPILAIRTSHDHEFAYIEFTDNGTGMSPEVAQRVFDPFFTTRRQGEGMGLGLSVAYGIVREHGGRILARSEEGEGATFTVQLPL